MGARNQDPDKSLFQWESSGDEVGFTVWKDGEPNNFQDSEVGQSIASKFKFVGTHNISQDCVEVVDFEKWNDHDCSEFRRFVCQLDQPLSLDIEI